MSTSTTSSRKRPPRWKAGSRPTRRRALSKAGGDCQQWYPAGRFCSSVPRTGPAGVLLLQPDTYRVQGTLVGSAEGQRPFARRRPLLSRDVGRSTCPSARTTSRMPPTPTRGDCRASGVLVTEPSALGSTKRPSADRGRQSAGKRRDPPRRPVLQSGSGRPAGQL